MVGFTFTSQLVNHFVYRALINSLPPSIVSFESLLSFRNSLGNANLGIHTKILIVVFYYRCI